MRKTFSLIILFVTFTATTFGSFVVTKINTAGAQVGLAVPTLETPGSPLIFNTTQTNVLIGLPGTTQAAVKGIRAALSSTCSTLLTTLDKTDSVSSVVDISSNSALEAIGGGFVESSKLSAAVIKATSAKECIDGYVLALSNVSAPTLLIGNDLQREQDRYTKLSNSLRQVIEDLKARQSASVKDIMRAFMVKLVLNLNKNLTTNVVNNMMQKYKIDDYLAYGDALATQVYSMKFINENYEGDARKQMMMRSIILSEKFPQKVNTALTIANQQAQEFAASKCQNAGKLDVSNLDSLNCLASLGNEQSSSMFTYLNALDEASEVKAVGVAKAQQEISQSNGFASERDCSGSIESQQQIDQATEQTTAEAMAARAVLVKLEDAFKKGQTTKAEVDKSQKAYDDSIAKLNNLPNVVGKPVVDICKAINSPASFVSNQLNKFLERHLDQGTQLQSSNLPFYANFLADMTSNFLTNLLTGGKSNSKVLKEAGMAGLSVGVIAATQAISGPGDLIQENTFGDSDVSVYITPANSNSKTTELTAGQNYVINIDMTGYNQKAATKPTPGRIEIRNKDNNELITQFAASQSNNIQKYSFVAPDRSAAYSVTLFDISNNEVKYVGFSFNIKGEVAGATTTVSNTFPITSNQKSSYQPVSEFSPRGPAFSIR